MRMKRAIRDWLSGMEPELRHPRLWIYGFVVFWVDSLTYGVLPVLRVLPTP